MREHRCSAEYLIKSAKLRIENDINLDREANHCSSLQRRRCSISESGRAVVVMMMMTMLMMELSGHSWACIAGILLSVYALYVEVRKHRDAGYVAACDLNAFMSCSRVLTSEYSRGFGVVRYLLGENHLLNLPNCITGIFFYCIQLILSHVRTDWARHFAFDLSVLSCLGSVYLAYILAFVLRDLCVVCIATYVVNAYLLCDNYGRLS